MQAIKFKNFTDRDFTWKYDGLPYTFKAGQEMYLEDFKANHFAKHLVNQELNRLEKDTGNVSFREPLMAKCLPPDEVVSVAEALDIEVRKSKGKGKKEEKEVEFPDLKKVKK